VPSGRETGKLTPLTVNVTPPIRAGLERIADREVLSLSDVARRAFLAEIERRDCGEARDDGR
jgi:hypothetical protein